MAENDISSSPLKPCEWSEYIDFTLHYNEGVLLFYVVMVYEVSVQYVEQSLPLTGYWKIKCIYITSISRAVVKC